MSEADQDCIFCKIVAGDMPAEILDSDEKTVSFMDINPATKGHALVIPRAHSHDLLAISDDDLSACTLAARKLAQKMEETLEPDGYNVLNCCRPAAWQTVFHFHLHVVPRYESDPLQLPWVPRGGDSGEIARTAGRIKGEG
jgi:histidine triad (HIT) family protein